LGDTSAKRSEMSFPVYNTQHLRIFSHLLDIACSASTWRFAYPGALFRVDKQHINLAITVLNTLGEVIT